MGHVMGRQDSQIDAEIGEHIATFTGSNNKRKAIIKERMSSLFTQQQSTHMIYQI